MKRFDVWRRPSIPPDRLMQMRDVEHRRISSEWNKTFTAEREYVDSVFAEIKNILNEMGIGFTIPPRNPSPPSGAGGGVGFR